MEVTEGQVVEGGTSAIYIDIGVLLARRQPPLPPPNRGRVPQPHYQIKSQELHGQILRKTLVRLQTPC